MPRQGNKATPAELRRLATMVHDGLSTFAKCTALNRSKTWVIAHSRPIREAAGIVEPIRHHYTPEEDATIQAMRGKHKQVQVIADTLGVSVLSLKGRINYLDVHSRANNPTPGDTLSQAIEGGFHGAPVEDIRAWMRDEVKRSRRLAGRSGWVAKRTKRTGKKVAA